MAFDNLVSTNHTGLYTEQWLKEDSASTPAAWLGTALLALLAASVFFISKNSSSSNSNISTFPLINPKRYYDLGGIRAKLAFVFGARRLLALGVRTGRPFRLLTDLGEMVVLPARYAHEIRSDPRLSFSEVIVQVYHCARNQDFFFLAHGLMDVGYGHVEFPCALPRLRGVPPGHHGCPSQSRRCKQPAHALSW